MVAYFGLLLLVAWLAVGPDYWPLGLGAIALFVVGSVQMRGWLRPI